MERDDAPVAKRDQIELSGRKTIHWLMALLVVYVISRGVVCAATKPFWYDELITLTLSSLPNMRAVWGALARALDGSPAGFYVVQRSALGLLQNKQIALRLPAILAFPCTLFCVFVYLKKRSGDVVAFLCAFLLLSTVLFSRYAVEARPYSLVVACVAFALVCYQRAPSEYWAALLGISLVLAQTLHHYAVFAIVPFGLAEAAFFLRTHKLRLSIWLALACGPVPLLFFRPLLTNLRAYYGAHLFERYSLTSLPSTYGDFFLTDSGSGVGVATLAIAGAIGVRLFARARTASEPQSHDADVAEGILLLAMVALPLIIYSLIKIMHGGMRSTYALGAVIGVCLALGCTLAHARPAVLALFAVFLFSNAGAREFIFWRSNHSLRLAPPTAAVEEFIGKSGYSSLPVVVASGVKYTPYAYYASPTLYKRLYYLTDEEKQLQYQGADTFDKNVVILKDYMPLQIRDYTEFTAEHSEFLVYAEEPDDKGTWLPIYLSREAASMRTVGMEPSRRLYLVTMKGNTSH